MIYDIIFILIFLLGVYGVYSKGFIKCFYLTLVNVISLVIGLVYKSQLAEVMYTNLPFFKLPGILEGVSAINILIYEIIAFILISILVTIVMFITYKLFGIDKLLKLLADKFKVLDKLLSIVVGFVEMYLTIYVLVVVFTIISSFINIGFDSKLGPVVIKTPILYKYVNPLTTSVSEITELSLKYEKEGNVEDFNKESINILLDNGILTDENLQILVENGMVNLD